MTGIRYSFLDAEVVLETVIDTLLESTEADELIELLQKQLKRLHSL